MGNLPQGDGWLPVPPPLIRRGGGRAEPESKFWSRAGLTDVSSDSGWPGVRKGGEHGGDRSRVCARRGSVPPCRGSGEILRSGLRVTGSLSEEVACHPCRSTTPSPRLRGDRGRGAEGSTWIVLVSPHFSREVQLRCPRSPGHTSDPPGRVFPEDLPLAHLPRAQGDPRERFWNGCWMHEWYPS